MPAGSLLGQHTSTALSAAGVWLSSAPAAQSYDKMPKLQQILRSKPPGSKIIIFCSTKRMCDQLANQLRSFGASAIHGDKKQQERDWVLQSFKVCLLPPCFALWWLCILRCHACRAREHVLHATLLSAPVHMVAHAAKHLEQPADRCRCCRMVASPSWLPLTWLPEAWTSTTWWLWSTTTSPMAWRTTSTASGALAVLGPPESPTPSSPSRHASCSLAIVALPSSRSFPGSGVLAGWDARICRASGAAAHSLAGWLAGLCLLSNKHVLHPAHLKLRQTSGICNLGRLRAAVLETADTCEGHAKRHLLAAATCLLEQASRDLGGG